MPKESRCTAETEVRVYLWTDIDKQPAVDAETIFRSFSWAHKHEALQCDMIALAKRHEDLKAEYRFAGRLNAWLLFAVAVMAVAWWMK